MATKSRLAAIATTLAFAIMLSVASIPKPAVAQVTIAAIDLIDDPTSTPINNNHTVEGTANTLNHPILVEVIGGPHTGSSELTSSGPDGKFSFTYPGTVPGTDTIRACYFDTQTSEILDICDTTTKLWTMFVIPESPIGLVALMGSSLAALGGYLAFRFRRT